MEEKTKEETASNKIVEKSVTRYRCNGSDEKVYVLCNNDKVSPFVAKRVSFLLMKLAEACEIR